MNKLKEALKNCEVTVGSWIQAGHPVVAEILANSGFDWVAADCEHADIDVEIYANLVRSMRGTGCIPAVRVRENDTLAIRQMLDAGAMSVIVPLVNTKEDAIKAVKAAKYPPEGIRGYAFVQANNWGKDFDEYAKTANDEIAVIAMIETKEAVENIEEILSVDGIDGTLIGPYDLSGSYGVAGQTSHQLVIDAKEKVLNACKKYRKAAGQHIVLPTKENVAQAIEHGYTFLALGMDTVFLADGAKKALEMIRII